MSGITKDFGWNDFNHSGQAPGVLVPATDRNLFGAKVLCESLLQPIRDHIGKPLLINSGFRDRTIYEALKRAGYPASATSDHFFWCELNPTGSGAADITWEGFKDDGVKVFEWISESLLYNQVIIYPDQNFIHVSNHRSRIFCYPIQSRMPIAVYRNGQYQPYKKGEQ